MADLIKRTESTEIILCRNNIVSNDDDYISQKENINEINNLDQGKISHQGEKKTSGNGAEVDEMWSFVEKKGNQRWLWSAIDHLTGKTLAFVFGERKDSAFLELKELLKPFNISQYFTDNWGAYDRHVPEDQHVVGKRNTQKIERKHLTLRTRIKRLARKTICFSKTIKMHDIVIGLFINSQEFGLQI